MKVMLNTEKIYTIRRMFQNNELSRKNFIPNIKTSALQISDTNSTQNKFIKKVINFFKPKDKEFNVEQSPIIAKLEGQYGRFDIPDPKNLKYGSVDRILAEIYVKQAKNGEPGYIIKHNLEQIKEVPDVVKKMIKPHDISPNGHIAQNTINKAYSIAKQAGEIPTYKYPPTFAANVDISESTSLSKSIDAPQIDISHEIPSEISGLDAPVDVVDSRFEIFNKIDSDNGIDVDNLTDLSVQTTDILDSDVIENVVKKSGDILENLLDSLPDFH